MEKDRIEFAISFLEQNGNVQIFFYINSNCVFLRPFEEKNPVAQWRMFGRIFYIISGTGGKF